MRILAVALALLAPPATHDVLPVFVLPAGSHAVAEYGFDAVGGPATPIRLGVFRRPRTMADVVPPEAQQLARFAGGDVARSRLLLAAGGVRVYAFPADRGRLCIVRVRLGGSCISALIHGVYPQVEPRRDVWGIVDDGAASVDVTVGRRTLRAHLGRNAFFLRLPARAVVPTRIVVRERDGARHVFTVRRCTPRDVSPLSSPLGPPC